MPNFTEKSGGGPSAMKMYGKGKNPIMFKSPMKDKKGYSKEAKNLLKVVPNKEAYDKLSEKDKKGFNEAAKKAGLPMETKKTS